MRRVRRCLIAATVVAICCGCGGAIKKQQVVKTNERPVAKDATQEELLAKYNAYAESLKSLNATVELKPTAGSKYSGVIDEYHEVKAFVLAARPERIRMIGQAPVIGKTVFDMTSDGETFRVSIPTKNKFIVGSTAVEKTSQKPIENLRPQHLVDALLWPMVNKAEAVLFEEFNDENARYYLLTVLRGGYQPEILRKIWFDRADLQVARMQTYGPKGTLVSDARFSDWRGVAGDQEHASEAAAPAGPGQFPMAIRIERPHDDYKLELTVTKIMLNEDLGADRFTLQQPAGSEFVQVGNPQEKKQP
jgi:outer membrane lipoprotein-sorting protein